MVESRHLDGAGRSRLRELHHLHRTRPDAAPGLRRRRLARQRADLRLSLRGRRRHGDERAVQFQYAMKATASITRRIRASRSIRFPTRRSRRRTGSRAVSPATSICAAAATATCSSSIAIVATCTSCTTSSTTAASGTPARARSSTSNANGRRPDGWTSADAAGLAILPGLVRYDEVFGAARSATPFA